MNNESGDFMYQILVVEDDVVMQQSLKTLLEEHGYQVHILKDFELAYEEFQKHYQDCDLILLDIQIPYMNGELLLKEIRSHNNIPIIMVTSRNSELDEMLSMSYGADDYITKPYNPSILLLRIEAILRRTKKEVQTLTYHHIHFNLQKGQLETADKVIPLSKNEMRIFHFLLQHQGEIVSREDIMKYLWDTEEFIDDNTLTVNISRIRKRLQEAGIENAIETKKGLGYILL